MPNCALTPGFDTSYANQMKRSTDDSHTHYFRTERVFLSNEQYYFSTREGVDQGPYANPNDAEKALGHYVQTQRTMQRLRRRGPARSDDTFDQDGVASISKDIRSGRDARKPRDG